jgi:hypothetical protein
VNRQTRVKKPFSVQALITLNDSMNGSIRGNFSFNLFKTLLNIFKSRLQCVGLGFEAPFFHLIFKDEIRMKNPVADFLLFS